MFTFSIPPPSPSSHPWFLLSLTGMSLHVPIPCLFSGTGPVQMKFWGNAELDGLVFDSSFPRICL